jgi:hypothetical protein
VSPGHKTCNEAIRPTPFDALNAALKAAGEARLRVLVLLAEAGSPSPTSSKSCSSRSRAFRVILAAGGSGLDRAFAKLLGILSFGRARRRSELAHALIARLDPDDPVIARDRERLSAVRQARRGRNAAPMPQSGTVSASFMLPTLRLKAQSRRSPITRFARCSI